MNALAHQKHRLVLATFPPRMEIELAGDLRRPNVPDGHQFRQLLIDAIPPRQWIQNPARVSQLRSNKFFCLRAVGPFQPTVGVGDGVSRESLLHDLYPGSWRPRHGTALSPHCSDHEK